MELLPLLLLSRCCSGLQANDERETAMTLLLIVVLLIVLFGGGYGGWQRWGAPGGLGVVGLLIAIALILWLLGALPNL